MRLAGSKKTAQPSSRLGNESSRKGIQRQQQQQQQWRRRWRRPRVDNGIETCRLNLSSFVRSFAHSLTRSLAHTKLSSPPRMDSCERPRASSSCDQFLRALSLCERSKRLYASSSCQPVELFSHSCAQPKAHSCAQEFMFACAKRLKRAGKVGPFAPLRLYSRGEETQLALLGRPFSSFLQCEWA